jgi:CheY-like chemotaxis protein
MSLVLVVDDNADDQHIVTAILRFFGFTVLAADDGAQAVRLAENWLPSVAVIDLAMPGVSGTDVARVLRAH